MVALANSVVQYVDSTQYNNVAQWATSTSYTAGHLIRQLAAPTLGNERVFVCLVSGSSSATTEPTWIVTKGGTTFDNGGSGPLEWQECTGQPGVNGDITNSPVWGASLTVTKGQIIYDSVTASLQICVTAGTTKSGSPPSFSATAGTATADGTAQWISIGLASNFGAFAAPHKRILNADALNWGKSAGNVTYIGDDHAETQSTTLSLSGGQSTASNTNQYLCVSHTSAPPTSCTTGASVSTTGASNLNVENLGYYYGISFNAGTGSSTANINITNTGINGAYPFFEQCSFNLGTTATSSKIILTTSSNIGTRGNFNGCAFTFGATGQLLNLEGGIYEILGGSMAATGTVPTTLISVTTVACGFINIRDCDLSAETGNLLLATGTPSALVQLENCKLGAAVNMTTGSFAPGQLELRVANCDSGSKNYRFYGATAMGTVQQETTTVDNTTIASDGTTQISWNITTTADASFGQPYCPFLEIAQWNDLTSGSHTATIQIAGANSLTNADIWMELEYLGSSLTPIGSIVTSRAADALATPATLTTSTDSWGGSPAHTQKMSVTFTPAMKGPVKARIYVAKPSITVYVNPIITIT